LITPKTIFEEDHMLDTFLSEPPPSSRRQSTTPHVFVIVNPTSYTLENTKDEDECEEIKLEEQQQEKVVFDHDETVCALRIGDREERLTG
jgi:hypothetical protein